MVGDDIKKRLECAIDKLYQDDNYLLQVESHEVSIAHRLAVYMEPHFVSWNIDLEYNRDKDEIKKRKNGREFRPDIIVHKRGTDDNLVAIEIKTEWNRDDCGSDVGKLKELTSGKFAYKVGIFLQITQNRKNVKLIVISVDS